ncbi:hypothetical protein QE152_g36031 [Popillia japonica]|uniref:Copia protein n=1 Tax=Popillia japonica TaxID=7064 RepID=A0AAW1IED2_POPJA
MDESSQIEKLVDEESYQIWKFQIMVVFKAYGLADVVDGSSSLEKLTKAEEKDVWLKKDAKAQKIIATTIEKKLMMYIINCERAKDMFDKIKNIFEKSSHEKYKYFLTAWESTSISEKTITNLTSRLVAEELGNKVRENDIAEAFKSSDKQCYKCKSKGHTYK